MTPEETAQILLQERLKLTSFIRSMVLDAHTADDLFQETCIKAVAKAAEFRTAKDASTWSRTVARNRALDVLRQRRGRLCYLSEETLEALAADDEATSPSETGHLAALERCLPLLTERAQLLVNLRYKKDLSPKSIAREWNCKVSAVYKMLSRSYLALRDCINRSTTFSQETS
ncbi:MAG: sigma-70 family RNA polymerase sigma factor [Verrucomicrobiota bacterium]